MNARITLFLAMCFLLILQVSILSLRDSRINQQKKKEIACEAFTGTNKAICLAVSKKSLKECLTVEKYEDRDLCSTIADF